MSQLLVTQIDKCVSLWVFRYTESIPTPLLVIRDKTTTRHPQPHQTATKALLAV